MNITDTSDLRALYGDPTYRAANKEMTKLDAHCRNFIALSPFVVIATSGTDGRADASPKGDAPGFVAVLDDHTLVVPDRPGNNRVDSLQNVVAQPHVGLLFLVPGMNETLRVNGRAAITTEPTMLKPLAVQGKLPKSALRVDVEEVFLHCGKALIRSKLWDQDTQIDRASFPTLGKILSDQIGGLDPEEADRQTEEGYRTKLY